MKHSGKTLQTTKRSLEILEFIKQNNGTYLNEILDEFDLSKSTTQNHLTTLQNKEYIIKENGEYYTGMKLFHLGEHAKTRKLSYEVISDELKSLSADINLTADFGVEEYGRMIIIFDETPTMDRGFQVGQYSPIHASAAGKAILAEYSTDHVNDLIDRRGLPKQTENTITSREVLFDELQKVQKNGYAVNDGESLDGIQAVAAVVKGPNQDIIGALSIYGPTFNFPSYEEVSDLLLPVIEDLEEKIQDRWQTELQSSGSLSTR